jgi:hypothetical protein
LNGVEGKYWHIRDKTGLVCFAHDGRRWNLKNHERADYGSRVTHLPGEHRILDTISNRKLIKRATPIRNKRSLGKVFQFLIEMFKHILTLRDR